MRYSISKFILLLQIKLLTYLLSTIPNNLQNYYKRTKLTLQLNNLKNEKEKYYS